MQLTYASHLQTAIQAILSDGETLGQLTGPGVFFVKTDGDDPAYVQIMKDELPVEDPLNTPGVEQAIKAQAAKAEADHAAAVKAEAAAAAPKPAAPAAGHAAAHPASAKPAHR